MRGIVEAHNSMVSCGEKEKVISFTQSIIMAGRNLVPVNTSVQFSRSVVSELELNTSVDYFLNGLRSTFCVSSVKVGGS